MAKENTWYPGIGADEEIARLEHLVGKITAFWAGVEDHLFTVFLAAIAGTPTVHGIRPYRAVFFTFSAYEGKMRMTDNAMKARFGENEKVMLEWIKLKKALDGASKLRNEIAHLVPMAKGTQDQNAKANVRLVPPFWKSISRDLDFDEMGYSWDQLTKALAPFWGFDPSLNIYDTSQSTLGYRLQEFTKVLPLIVRHPRPVPSSNA